MEAHKCNKEVEIAEIHKDVRYIIKLLDGNGKPGLKEMVEKNTKFRYIFEGKELKSKSLLGDGWLVAIAIIIIQIVLNFVRF